MIHLLDKLTPGDLGFLILVAVIAAAVTICSVFRSISAAIESRTSRRPPTQTRTEITGGHDHQAPSPADEET